MRSNYFFGFSTAAGSAEGMLPWPPSRSAASSTLCVTSHFEFQKLDGQYALDLLWQQTDPSYLKAELDTFWMRYGGEDPARYIATVGSRTLILHLKDLLRGPPVRFGEVGTGMLNFATILAAAEEAGVRWGVVEQDSTYERPPLQSLRISFESLKRLGAV
jgi:sugar phosphate isomerase/epimerase